MEDMFMPDSAMEDVTELPYEGGGLLSESQLARDIARQRLADRRDTRRSIIEESAANVDPQRVAERVQNWKNFENTLGSMAPILVSAIEAAGTNGESTGIASRMMQREAARRQQQEASELNAAKLAEMARKTSEAQSRKDIYSKATEGMLSGVTGEQAQFVPMIQAMIKAGDVEEAARLTTQLMKPEKEAIELSPEEVLWASKNNLQHLTSDPKTLRSVMAYQAKQGMKPEGWSDQQWADYQKKLDMQAATLGEKKDVEAGAKREAEVAEAQMGMDKTVNLFKNLWDRKKEQLGQQGAGVILGTGKQLAAKARIPGFEATGAYPGQRIESALALSKIVTGQNRVIKSIVERLSESLPDLNDTESYARAKLEQSIRNAYGLQKAMNAYGSITEEEAERIGAEVKPAALTPDDETAIQEIMRQVFGGGKPSGAPKQAVPVVTTQEQFNKLKSGATYREETNGPLYRKP